MNPVTLAQGSVSTEDTVLYSCPTDKERTTTTLIVFVNTDAADVTLNVYKKVNEVNYLISPADFSFGGKYRADEDGEITLNPGDAIVAACSVADKVQYTVNGIEYSK